MDIGDIEREERRLQETQSSRWWLRLSPELLTRFYTERNAADLRASRMAVLCAILVLDSFIFSDAKIVHDVVGLAVWFRLLVLTPLALVYVPLSYWLVRRDPATSWQHVYVAGFATLTVAWVCVIQVQTRAPTGGVFFVGAYLVVVFYLSAMRGPLVVRVPAVVLMTAIFLASMPWVVVMPASQRVDAALCMVGFAVFGVLGSHREEYSARQRFILNQRTMLLESRRELLLAELATANERLTHQATRDALTGVPNRRAIDDAMVDWSGGEPSAGALLVIDLDHFKAYNDGFGHQGGDVVLKRVAQTMSESVRGDDVMLARYGGEEFVAILRQVSCAGARRAAERVRAAVEGLQIPVPEAPGAEGQRFVTVSVGGAWTASTALSSADRLLSLADVALYEAKAAGRNTVRFGAPIGDPNPVTEVVPAADAHPMVL